MVVSSDTQLDAVDVRTRILRATFDLIGAEGMGALTNRRIAAAAGISLGSLTYYFPSQDALLRESLALYVGEEVRRLEAIAAELRARRPGTRELGAEIRDLASRTPDRPELIAELELHLHAARDPAVRSASRESFEAYEKVATAALAAFGVPDPERHAVAVVALMMGVGIRQLGTGSRDPAGLVEGLWTIVLGARAQQGDGAASPQAGRAAEQRHGKGSR